MMELLSNSLKEKAEDFQRQAAISVAGEQLRLRLHNAKLIKDRCHHMLTYPNCFVAKELVDWLIDHKEAPDRGTAISIMQTFMDNNVIHHVCDEYAVFKDAKLLYRFRNDDGTLSPSKNVKIFVRGQKLYDIMANEEDSILKVREQGSEKYRRTFLGQEMLDWLVKHGEVSKRTDGEELCRAMLEFGIIQHVSGHQHFSDSDALFQFCINFRRRRKLIEVLNDLQSCAEPRPDSPDSPFCLRKLSSDLPHTSFVCVETYDEKAQPTVRRSSYSNPTSSGGYHYSQPSMPLMTPPSVLKRPVSIEELLAPGAPFIRKTLNIIGDDVGWGFVIRGASPCHIQAVDPGGPAAAAGMKFISNSAVLLAALCNFLSYEMVSEEHVSSHTV
ncbi:DEP domain-containing mTOR-interacting protein-like [Bombina bombina]|uniref:DEP domain-containing mTOR-interacting protein-like n=1 Tax=Bombina bombina TaxID=8345 RepID=UPI00235B22A4|nr:DEP domain-containing mTOR-interacting protein-like [Bombina bombina]